MIVNCKSHQIAVQGSCLGLPAATDETELVIVK